MGSLRLTLHSCVLGPANMAMTEEDVVMGRIRDHFKTRANIISEIQVRTTLGMGNFGRVRQIESAPAREELASHDIVHTGIFALKIMKKSEIIRLKQGQHVHDERKLLLRLKNPFIVKACAPCTLPGAHGHFRLQAAMLCTTGHAA